MQYLHWGDLAPNVRLPEENNSDGYPSEFSPSFRTAFDVGPCTQRRCFPLPPRSGEGMQNGPPGEGGPFAGGYVPGNYFLDFFAGAAGAVAAGSWVLGWIASITGVAMKTEA